MNSNNDNSLNSTISGGSGDGNFTERKIKVIMAKPGLDGHDRGAKLLTRIFAEAGMEVVYTGLRQTPEMIVATAEQESADVIGLSSLSGVHNYFFPRIAELMKQKGLDDVLLLGGGIIPEEDHDFLQKSGMAAIFGPGTPTSEIVDYIRNNVRRS